MEWVADHLGHTLDVEKTYYRLMSSTIEKAKVAKLLILADEGRVEDFKGKNLDEIQFDGRLANSSSWMLVVINSCTSSFTIIKNVRTLMQISHSL